MTKPGTNRAATLTLVLAVILTGLSAGFFATYYYSVTRALATVSDPVYVTTFQAINATVRSVEFGLIFFGSLPALIIATVLQWSSGATRNLLLLATVAYCVMLAITFTVHIPLNEALAVATDASTARLAFESHWNNLHLARTLAVCVSFVLTVTALTLRTG